MKKLKKKKKKEGEEEEDEEECSSSNWMDFWTSFGHSRRRKTVEIWSGLRGGSEEVWWEAFYASNGSCDPSRGQTTANRF